MPPPFARINAEDYLLARLSANWQVSRHLDVFARVENLFGDDYSGRALLSLLRHRCLRGIPAALLMQPC
jgi:outer membrane receptor for ferrienterochelin and colicin